MQHHSLLFTAVALVAAVTAAVVVAPHEAAAGRRAAPPVLAQAAADISVRHRLRIIAFGSSSTEGIGASSPRASYPSRLQGELIAALPQDDRIEVLNRGIGGEDAEDMARRLPSVLAEHPDLVIWQTGTNDVLRGLPLPRFIALTRAGILAMRAAGSDVMLMEPQDCPTFSDKPGALAYRDAVRALGAELSVPVIRRFDLMRDWLKGALLTRAQMQAPDGLHMADAGYALLAKAVATTILTDIKPPAPIVTVSDRAR